MQYVSDAKLNKIINFEHYDPFEILGFHTVIVDGKQCGSILAFIPSAKQAWIINLEDNQAVKMNKIHNDGFFEYINKQNGKFLPYELKIEYDNGFVHQIHDPYSFLPVISDLDRHLFNEGSHQEAYEKLGAHIMEINGIKGVQFAVWAPNAKAVSVMGDFNGWDNRRHQMRVLGHSGIWEIFIPGLSEGDIYKYTIKTQDNHLMEKADPYGFYAEMRPKTGSIVWNINKYQWNDENWLNKRSRCRNLEKPMSIYEVHLGSWMRIAEENNRYLNYRESALKLTEYLKKMNYTHIELMPIAEHPFDGSWGYQVTGYFAPTSRFGTPEDFMFFIDTLHQNDIGVIIDWVPGHFPKDAHGLCYFDGTALYEHFDSRKGEHMDWGTKIFNFGRNEVKNFLISNALFWLSKYHIDGLRVDAVASMIYLDYSRKEGEWIPNQYGGRENLEAIDFLKKMNELVFSKFPGTTTIAEESTAFGGVSRPTYVGGLGFEFKWNMGWMHDTLVYFSKDPIYRKYHQGTLTFSMIYAYSENFILVLSHDEVVHGKASLLSKMPGDDWQKFANLRLLYTYMTTHPGKKLLFMGQEFAQWDEWSESKSIDWHLTQYESHYKIQNLVSDLNYLYKNEPALYEVDFNPNGFEWIDFYDSDNSIISYIRRAKNGDFVVVVHNLTPTPHCNYKVGTIQPGYYSEIFNSDSEKYGGSNMGNNGGVTADEVPWNGKLYSLNITLPPLGGLIFKLRNDGRENYGGN